MATFTRSAAVNYLGSPAAPVTVAAGLPATSTPVDLSVASATADFEMTAVVGIGSTAPGTNPTVQWLYSYDGANYLPDGGPFVVPIDAVSTSYSYGYSGRPAARFAKCTIANGSGASINAYVQGATLGVG